MVNLNYNLTQSDVYYYLQRGKSYEVKMRAMRYTGAYGDAGQEQTGYSNTITVTAPGSVIATPPASPTNLTAAANIDAENSNARSFGLHWDDVSPDDTGFEVQERNPVVGSNPFVSLGVLGAPAGTSLGLGLNLANGYAANDIREFKVRSVRGNGPFRVFSNAFTNTASASQKDFDPPTDLRISAPADNGRVMLFWSDNATSEMAYELEYRVAGVGSYTSIGSISSTAYSRYQADGGVGFFPPGTLVEFRIRATKTTAPTTTAYSNVASVTMPALTAPTGLAATVLGEQSVKLDWVDNSGNEHGYLIQARLLPNGNFADVASTAANVQTFTLNNTHLPYPGVSYEFRVVAAHDPGSSNPLILSSFSNTVSSAVPFHAPTTLAGVLSGENTVNLTWLDNSSVETSYLVLVRQAGQTQWGLSATKPANTTSHSATNLAPGIALEFAIVGVFTRAANDEVQSALSNIFQISTLFNAPSGFTATPVSDRQINLAWTDNSNLETAYAVLCKRSIDSQYQVCAVLPAGANSFQARSVDQDFNSPFTPNVAYDFQVFAVLSNSETTHQNASATTKDGVTSDLSPPMFVGDVFNHTIQFTQGQGTVTSAIVTGTLPPGVNYNAGTFTLSGTPTTRGAFPCTLAVTWSNSWTQNYTLHLRPLHHPGPPVVSNPIGNQTLTLGGTSTASLPLANVFSDLDSESAVRLDIPAADGTPSGRSITIILNNSVTPQTVANFMAYLGNAANGYTNTIFHRLVPGFILQGGAYKSSTAPAAPSNAFVSVPKLPAVANEPGISNVTGTLAMAKQAGNPNSATTDFFFNLANNASNLDAQNDGFTVFGRVTQSSLSLLTGTLNNLPLPPSSGNPNAPNYAVTVDGSNTVFTALPTNASGSSGPASIDSSKLLRVNGVDSSVELLARSVSGNSNATVVTAVINGSNLDLTGLAPGVSTVSLQATDLDGNQLVSPATFTVTVRDSFSNWAGGQGLPPGDQDPGDDPDFDNWTNLLEWALMTSPSAGNGSSALAPLLQPDGGGSKGAITFPVRKFATLTYIVEASGDLGSSSWSTVWTSTDGFAAAAVVAAVDHPDHTLVTIKDTAALGTGVQRFLRLRVTSP